MWERNRSQKLSRCLCIHLPGGCHILCPVFLMFPDPLHPVSGCHLYPIWVMKRPGSGVLEHLDNIARSSVPLQNDRSSCIFAHPHICRLFLCHCFIIASGHFFFQSQLFLSCFNWFCVIPVRSYHCVLFPQLSMEKVQAMAEQVEIKAKVVQTEVKALVLRHKKALEERECELLWKVSCYLHVHQSPVTVNTGKSLFYKPFSFFCSVLATGFQVCLAQLANN